MNIALWDEKQSREMIDLLSIREQSLHQGLGKTNCVLLSTRDGRLVSKGVKVAYGYQVAALQKFGREQCCNLVAAKKATDLVISHNCGTALCINPDHLLLEPKCINDERTHCHFVLTSFHCKHKQRMPDNVVEMFCPHTPYCASL